MPDCSRPPDGAAGADSRCPRCAGPFHCGANDAQPCACTGVTLQAEALAALRLSYRGCLCLRCLNELALPAQIAAEGLPQAR